MNKIKIYYMGAGNIAVPILNELLNNDKVELVGIGTQLDQPAGRKKNLTATPVGIFCEERNINIDKIASANSAEFIDYLKKLNPDFILVVSFGQLLKEEILNLPKISCVNVHSSLLPLYRGASPIVAAIANGDDKTGVTFMKMEKGLDTGPIYKILEYMLDKTEYADGLEIKLGELAADNAVDILTNIANEKLIPVEQDNKLATKVGKVLKKDGVINWNEDAKLICQKIRAYFPWPGVSFVLKGKKRSPKIGVIESEEVELNGKPGEVLKIEENNWIIACKTNAINIKRLIPSGKKEMTSEEFFRGFNLELGTIIE